MVFSFLMTTFQSEVVWSQQNQGTGQADGQEVKKTTGPRRQLATIVFAGLGGAVLGLSTLSFYGRPQDNLVNIAIGFAVGVIAGTVFVTYKAVSTKDYYEQQDEKKKASQIYLSPFVTESKIEHKPDGGGANLSLNF